MDENSLKAPGERLNKILLAGKEEENAQPKPQPQIQSQSQSPLANLPRIKQPMPPAPQTATQATQAPQLALEPASQYKGLKFGPPFWTITGILSLAVNGVLVAVVLVLLNMLGPLQGTAGNIGSSLIGGLYSNFEKMDRATIKTVIPVDAQIPLNITVPVQTTTQITLAEAVEIPNAYVRIITGAINIDSTALIILPAGTPLMVNLNFDLPVQAMIPIHLEVPVDIPMAETELHEPFVGLQEVVRPLYCLVEPEASNLDGQAICR